ncbi:MAG: enoyl-CoA hydratase-related protein [Bacteroidia bacterium]|nr:enoyl-CoA hydratase-related protein [Bacteroidia bacterium]
MNTYRFFEIEPIEQILFIRLNHPEKLNAMNSVFWEEFPNLCYEIEEDINSKVIVWSGNGKAFCSGLDVAEFFKQNQSIILSQNGNQREELRRLIRKLQSGFEIMATGRKIHIVAIHGACIGGGLDLAVACDIRLCSEDAFFSLRETKVAIVADLGSLNRLPSIIGQGNTRLMAFTGADFTAQQAFQMQLVSQVYPTREELLSASQTIAQQIASNPRLTLQGVKQILNYQHNHSPSEGLDYVANWNAAFLDTNDFREVIQAFVEKQKPKFQD